MHNAGLSLTVHYLFALTQCILVENVSFSLSHSSLVTNFYN